MRSRPSRTAEWVAFIRALETQRPADRRVVHDPWAQHFLSPALRLALAADTPMGRRARDALGLGMSASIVGRHRFIDEVLVNTLQAEAIDHVGARSFFGGEGMFLLKATGMGPIAFNSFGAIKEIEVDGEFVVDNGHIVAFEDTLQFRNTKFGGGWIAAFLGGEGLVCRFSGSGRLWIQTRNPQAFGEALGPKLPMRSS